MKIEDVPMDETWTNKKGEIVPRYRTLSNGAIFDNSLNHIVAATKEHAATMVKKRWDSYRDAAAKGILKEAMSIDPSVRTNADAWALLISKQYTAFLDEQHVKGDDLIKIGQILGAMPRPDETQRQPAEDPETVIHTLDPSVVMLLQQIADAQRQDADIIEAPVFEIPFPDEHKKRQT